MSLFQTIDPATGQLVRQFDVLDGCAINAKIEKSYEAFLEWKGWDFHQRAAVLRRVAQDLSENASIYAQIMKLEMGKPKAEGEAEVKKCALLCHYYADNAAAFLAPCERPTEASLSLVRYDPLGIILAIMPWNFPFWQVARVAVPSLMAGNVILLKHAANTPQCALSMERIFASAPCPQGTFTSLFVCHEDIEAIIADPRVKGLSLTGSTRAGARVAELAGRHLKPCVMELGGSDPFIVFDDADIKAAAEAGAASRCLNSGQSCINAKRFLINANSVQDFSRHFVKAMQAQDIGPLATKEQREIVHQQVKDALDKGALAHCGGAIPKGPGFFYPPTVLTKLNESMRLWHEEVFGPVASLIPFVSDDEALNIANTTDFGLSAGIWTFKADRIERFCRDLECGAVFVNELVKSDPRLPFGGIKASGFGRELGQEGIKTFVNVKTVWRR